MSQQKRIRRDQRIDRLRSLGLPWRVIGCAVRLSAGQAYRRWQAMRQAYAA